MKASIISIGNSKGIRIPKSVLDQCKFNKEAELEVQDHKLIIKPVRKKARSGWDKAFKLMHDRKEDVMLVNNALDVELEKWKW